MATLRDMVTTATPVASHRLRRWHDLEANLGVNNGAPIVVRHYREAIALVIPLARNAFVYDAATGKITEAHNGNA